MTVESIQVAQLELDGVGPGLLGKVDEVLGQRDVTLVVIADLSNEKTRVAIANGVTTDGHLGGTLSGDRREMATLVNEGDHLHAGAKELGNGRSIGIERCMDALTIGSCLHRRRHVAVWFGGDPAAEVAVGEGPGEDAVFIDAEDDARLVVGDLCQCGEDGVLTKDGEGCGLTVDDHGRG